MKVGKMIEFIYIPIILLLYLRTYKYRKLIDDPVPRDGYLYQMADEKLNPAICEERRSILTTITNVGIFIAVCSFLHYMYGWKVALLFAVFPLNVSGVAWTTGNYYMSTTLLILATHACVMTGQLNYAIGATFFYAAALNSTVNSLPYAFVGLFYPFGWLMFIPLATFLFGKRFKTGLAHRVEKNISVGQVNVGKIQAKNFLHVPKTIAYYIVLSLWPSRLGFFHALGKTPDYFTIRFLFLSCLLVNLFLYWSMSIDPIMSLWWFLCIGIFSQYVIYGQFTSERYTMVANVAFCVLIGKFLEPYPIPYTVLVTLWFYRSHLYIPSWQDNEVLFTQSITAFPESPENFNNLASLYINYGKFDRAIRPLLVCLKLMKKDYYGIHCNLAICYREMGLYMRALNHAQEALRLAPVNKRKAWSENVQELNNKLVDLKKNEKQLKKMGVL